MKGAQTTVI